MKKCYLDSNVLIYFKDQNSPYYQQALKTILKLNPQKFQLYISPLSLDEFLYSLQFILKQAGITQKNISLLLKNALHSILAFEHLAIVNPPTGKNKNKLVPKIMQDFNLHPRDAYHLLTMKEHGINIFATFDKDFKKVTEKKVVELI